MSINWYKPKELPMQMRNIESDANRKWISVKDRLPDISDRYAVCYKYGKLPLKRFVADFDTYYGWAMPVPDTEITHWMPLPEPPVDHPGSE